MRRRGTVTGKGARLPTLIVPLLFSTMWCSAVFEVTSTANGLVCHVHTKEDNNLTSVGEPHGDMSSAVAELESLVGKGRFRGSRSAFFVCFLLETSFGWVHITFSI